MSNVRDLAGGYPPVIDELGFNGPMWHRAKEHAGNKCGRCQRSEEEGAVLLPELLVRANRYGEQYATDLRVRCEQCVGGFNDGVGTT